MSDLFFVKKNFFLTGAVEPATYFLSFLVLQSIVAADVAANDPVAVVASVRAWLARYVESVIEAWKMWNVDRR